MSATVITDAVPIRVSGDSSAVAAEVEFATCECCGLTEECTAAYIARVRELHHGRWICGLCAEAVDDELRRADRLITTEEALDRHGSFCREFRSSPPPMAADSAEHLITAMRHLLRRSLDSSSPRAVRSTPSSPRPKMVGVGGDETTSGRRSLARSGSCFPTIAG